MDVAAAPEKASGNPFALRDFRLLGLAYRLAALGGFSFSMLFFLTASWATHPYYFGADLPYALGWLTLGLAGHGNLFVLRLVRDPAPDPEPAQQPLLARLVSRRIVVQVGGLAALTFLVGGLAGALRFLRGNPTTGDGTDIGTGPSPSPGASGSPPPTIEPSGAPSAAPGIVVANVADVTRTGSRRFTIPITAPAPLPAGDPAVVIQLDDGSFVAYDALCTHEGCRVGWDTRSGVIVCPCHGAEFDAADHGTVLSGPTNIPLPELPLIVNQQDGTIALAIS